MKILFGSMKIIMKLKINFFIFLLYFSIILSFNIDNNILKVFKDSINFELINDNKINKKYQSNPDYIFFDALIEFDGDSASKKYQSFYSKYPEHKYADYAVYEVGSYYYTKGYYVSSSYSLYDCSTPVS